MRLIERMGKRAYATPAGEELIGYARRLAKEAEQALAAMRRHREGGWEGPTGNVGGGLHLSPAAGARRAAPDLLPISRLPSPSGPPKTLSRTLRQRLDLGVVTMPVKAHGASISSRSGKTR